MEWNEETIQKLRALWAEGLSTAEIGRRMGVSKNAVVGKAHRLALPARPSPIRRDVVGRAPRVRAPRRVNGSTLPSLAIPVPVAVEVAAPVVPASVPVPVVVDRAVTRPAAVVASPGPRYSRSAACCWPIGEPGTKSFRFCDAAATHGKPYCTEHAAVAYVKVRDRREDAAA